MKKILITGANSYIGTSFEKYIRDNYHDAYTVDTVDMLDGSWREKSFSGYDSVFHVAGIAHSNTGKISAAQEELYYKVNTHLAIETATKAKLEGVKQFIYMSSAIVYGHSFPIGKNTVIDSNTLPSPANCYGDSKLKAEQGISPLNDDNFKVAILRPPMIYGKDSKGNYAVLSRFAKKTPLFPYVKNCRSMLYITNLCEFVRLLVEYNDQGIFFPQNERHVNTSEMVKLIADTQGRKVWMISGFEWLFKIFGKFTGVVNKVFGNFAYDLGISKYRGSQSYCVVDFLNSIIETEKKNENIGG